MSSSIIAKLKSRLKRAETLVADTSLAARFVSDAGLAQELNFGGLASFAKALRNLRIGPHLSILFHAKNHGDREALVCGDTRWNYQQLDEEINRLSRALSYLGLSRGETVGLMLPNCKEHLVAQETMPRISALAVQIGYRLKSEEIAHILDNSCPQILIYHHNYSRELALANQRGGFLEESQLLVVGAPEDEEVYGCRYEEFVGQQSSDPIQMQGTGEGGVIIYTSGTTGKPKGATRNWKDTGLVPVIDLMSQTRMRSEDRHLVVCPLYHSGAQAFTKMMMGLGASLVLCEGFEAEAVLQMIEREKITCAFMVPTMLVRLNALSEEVRSRYDLSSLRWLMSGAAPLASATALRFQELYGPILYNFYGATETGTVTLACPKDHASRNGSVGKTLRGNELKILNEYGEELAPGKIGEVYVRNKMLIGGYYKNSSATQASVRDGYFSVGDLGKVDEDGYLYLASRKHDMVISGGVNIYPREIEELLHKHPMVQEAAVVGIADEEWGESLCAFVVPREASGLSAEEVIRYCNEELAGYKRPKKVVFLTEFPRNATGKILKRELRKSLA